MSIDITILNELKEIMEDEFDELISVFISDGEMQIENLKQAIHSSDVESIQRLSHTLKGSSANIGALDLSESCRLMEYNVAKGSLDNVETFLAKIITDFEQTRQLLIDNF